jgi:hypothetical protein
MAYGKGLVFGVFFCIACFVHGHYIGPPKETETIRAWVGAGVIIAGMLLVVLANN